MLLKPNEVGTPSLFGRPGPVILEAGFGDGGFMVHLALTCPAWNILGADVSRASVTRACRRLRRAGAKHVRLFHGNAEFVLRNFVAESGLHQLYVNFPDPWPKKRHRSRRLLNPAFFALLSTRLVTGGTVHLTTDSLAYYQRAVEDAEKSRLYEAVMPPPPAAVYTTKYGAKWNALERPVYHVRLAKVNTHPAEFPPISKFKAMHHALLSGPLPGLAGFTTFRSVFKTGQVVVTGVLARPGTSALVFEARVEEQDLIQDVLIEARPARAAHADVLVGVSTFGQPLPTHGTREAVKAVAQWLAARGMKIVESYF